jgi:hypothetical protein
MSTNDFFSTRSIECDRLPENVLEKAESIVLRIENGEHFQRLGGKRMYFDKTLISIPVGMKYRIIARDANGQLSVKYVVTHERYNILIKRR